MSKYKEVAGRDGLAIGLRDAIVAWRHSAYADKYVTVSM